jgi:hypothetical protein
MNWQDKMVLGFEHVAENYLGWLLLALLLLAVWLLSGCDDKRIARLEEGVATEADVRAAMGQPERIWPEADGGQTLEYNRQPQGHRNYMITVGPSGVMTSLLQVLTPERFALAQPGMTQEQVRRLYGKPARIVPYALRKETEWTWRHLLDGQKGYIFSVTFDAQGRLLHSAQSREEFSAGGGSHTR